MAETESEEEQNVEQNTETDTDDTWDTVGFIISSRYRILSLERLSESPAPPSQIAEDADVGIAHVSRALQDLKEKGLIDLLVPEERKKGRVYGITDEGRETWGQIENQQLH